MVNCTHARLKPPTILLAFAMVLGTAAGVRAATATWNANSEPDLAGYKLSYGTQPGVHTVVIDVGKVTTYQFNPPPGKKYYVVVQAYNTAGDLSEKSAEVAVDIPVSALPGVPGSSQPVPPPATPGGPAPTYPGGPAPSYPGAPYPGAPGGPAAPNHPPAMDQPVDQKTPVNWTVAFTLLASDPEGRPLTFTATGLPPGLSVDPSSGLVTGTATTLGSYQVTVTVSDGEATTIRSFLWAVVKMVSAATSATAEADSPATGMRVPAPDEEAGTDAPPLVAFAGASGDFDGDGRKDLATYRLSTGEWRIWTSSSNFATATVMVWGIRGDQPVAADYNGDRVTDLGVYRPSEGTWHLWLSGTATPMTVHWGGPEDAAVALDHDGDGKADLALIRSGGYDILLSGANYLKSVQVR